MKRPIEKVLIILNSIIGLLFVGSVIISKIPLLHLNILDKYLNFSFLKGWLLISAYILAGIYLVISAVLIINKTNYTNNAIYVYGEGSIKVTSRNIKKIAKAVVNDTEGVKSSKIDIELGEYGNCLTVHMKIEDGYDFQSLVAKLRPRLEEAIVEYLGIKFPSYKFADGNVLYEFGAPYSGVGIDLETSYQQIKKPIIKREEESIEPLYQEPYDDSAKKVIGDEVYPNIDFVPEKIDVTEEKTIAKEEPQLEPDQYSIPYAASNRKMGAKMEEPFDAKAAPNYKPFEQDINEKQAPFQTAQAAYENINREMQKQSFAATNPFEAKEGSRPQTPLRPTNAQNARPNQNYDQQTRVTPQTSQAAFRRPYPQRPIGVRPTPQNANTSINPNATQQPNTQGTRPAQRPSSARISKEDIYARINAILNKYSNLDDDNNK